MDNDIFSGLKDLTPRPIIGPKIEPVKDISEMIGRPIWPLEDGLNLLATLEVLHDADSCPNDDKYKAAHKKCLRLLYSILWTCKEYSRRMFHVFAEEVDNDGSPYLSIYDSTVKPVPFLEWADSISLNVPMEFFKKVKKSQIAREPFLGSAHDSIGDKLSAKERRELGQLRREKGKLDLAIHTTILAMEHCFNKGGGKSTRHELYDAMTAKNPEVTKELVERIIPLIPEKYRCKAGERSK